MGCGSPSLHEKKQKNRCFQEWNQNCFRGGFRNGRLPDIYCDTRQTIRGIPTKIVQATSFQRPVSQKYAGVLCGPIVVVALCKKLNDWFRGMQSEIRNK